MVPGPVLSVTITESAKRGAWAGPLIIAGHGILEIALLLLLVGGFAEVISNKLFISVVGVLGGLYLVWMSIMLVKDIKQMTVDFHGGRTIRGGPVVAGIMTSLANPYWIIWWATIGLGYVIMSMRYGMMGIVIFFTGHILADFSWYSMISFAVSRGKRFLNDRTYRILIGTCACMLFFFGVLFGLWGIRTFAVAAA
ncbi:MAG: LysE family transporter [Deltaproteobacteria bacterium]|nr:LysE family transporter [Deltaproteobacteria bacterium]